MDWAVIGLGVLALLLLGGAYQSFKKWRAGDSAWDLFFALCMAVGAVGGAAASYFKW